MNTLICLAVLSGWSYGDFASDPARDAPPIPAVAPASPVEVETPPPAQPKPENPPGPVAETVSAVRPLAPAVPPAAIRPPEVVRVQEVPTSWHLADAAGQVWVHADPVWLQWWVAARNTTLVAPPAPSYRAVIPAARGAACSGPRCNRGY